MRGNVANSIPNHNTIPQNFAEFPKKRTALPSILRFSEISYPECLFHLTLLSEFPEFSLKWFVFLKFKNFWMFWKVYQGNSGPFVPIFRVLWLNEKCLLAKPSSHFVPSGSSILAGVPL